MVKRELWTFRSIRVGALQNRHARKKTGTDDISAAIHRLDSRSSLQWVKHEFWPPITTEPQTMRTKMGTEERTRRDVDWPQSVYRIRILEFVSELINSESAYAEMRILATNHDLATTLGSC